MGHPTEKKKARKRTQDGGVKPPLHVKRPTNWEKREPKRADLKIGHYKRRKD
jgi:hypothetical protein